MKRWLLLLVPVVIGWTLLTGLAPALYSWALPAWVPVPAVPAVTGFVETGAVVVVVEILGSNVGVALDDEFQGMACGGG